MNDIVICEIWKTDYASVGKRLVGDDSVTIPSGNKPALWSMPPHVPWQTSATLSDRSPIWSRRERVDNVPKPSGTLAGRWSAQSIK